MRDENKPYGIEITLPEDDPLSAPHLLGDSWAGTRWFDTAEQRDRVLSEMQRQPGNYRRGDKPSVQYRKIDPV